MQFYVLAISCMDKDSLYRCLTKLFGMYYFLLHELVADTNSRNHGIILEMFKYSMA